MIRLIIFRLVRHLIMSLSLAINLKESGLDRAADTMGVAGEFQ
jgi:hypothetical protein